MFTTETLSRETIDKLTSELDVDTVFMILENYLEECRQRLLDLKSAIDNKDYETATRESHSMKSSSASFGAMKLSELGLNMEKSFREGRPEEAIKLMNDHLEEVTKETIDALSEWKQLKAS